MFRSHPGVGDLPLLTGTGIFVSNLGVFCVFESLEVRLRHRTRGGSMKSGTILSYVLFCPYMMVVLFIS